MGYLSSDLAPTRFCYKGDRSHKKKRVMTLEHPFSQLLHVWPGVLFGFFVIVAVLAKKLIQFYNYGIKLPQHDFQSQNGIYQRKIVCLIVLGILDALELGNSTNNFSVVTLLISGVILLLTIAMTYAKYNYKLSVEEGQALYLSYIDMVVLLLCAIFKFGQALSYGSDWAGDLKYLLLRLITLTIFTSEAILPPEGNIPKVDEDLKKSGVFATIRKFHPLREYILPSTTRGRIFGILFGMVTLAGSAVNFYQSIYSKKIVDSLRLDTENSTNSTTESSVFSQFGSARLEFRWDFILIYYGLTFLNGNFLWSIRHYLQQNTETDSCSKLQLALFSKLQNLSLRWHLENHSSEIYSMMSSSPRILEEIIETSSWLLPEILNMFVTVIYMLRSYSFKLSSVVILTGILSVIIDYFVMRRREKAKEEKKEAESKVRTTRSATFENYETMKYFTNEEYEKQKFKRAFFEDKSKSLQQFVDAHVFHSVRDFIRVGAEVVVILAVVKAVLGGDEGLTAGDYLYISGVFSSILWPLDSLIRFYKELQDKALSVEKISAVLNLVPEIVDEPNAPDLKIDNTGGSVEFKNVQFSYVPERAVIKDFSVFIPAGNTVAFVGRSGSGKSTLTKLLFRFYDTTAGEILINGQNIRKVKSMSLRKSISVVPQEVTLFADTIKRNIQYGKMDATDEEIEDAAKAAWLHDRIDSFPDKYETEVGNRGLKLSGGEKQRVAIARAVLRNTPILLLDEATSSLDTETEKQIQASLESLYEKRTTIIIAHRLSTIVNVNTIFVLNEGSIVESGCHAELLSSKDGVYASMWNQQFLNNGQPASESSDTENSDVN